PMNVNPISRPVVQSHSQLVAVPLPSQNRCTFADRFERATRTAPAVAQASLPVRMGPDVSVEDRPAYVKGAALAGLRGKFPNARPVSIVLTSGTDEDSVRDHYGHVGVNVTARIDGHRLVRMPLSVGVLGQPNVIDFKPEIAYVPDHGPRMQRVPE